MTTMQQASSPYESIDEARLAELTAAHAWIVEPITTASDAVLELPFFSWVDSLASPRDFAPAAVQLYHHSATFPKVMGLMLGTTPFSENAMMPFYAKHAFGEADHHQMLLQWMLCHGVVDDPSDIDDVVVTRQTNACINQAYQLAIEADRAKWIVTVNCGIERCSNHFFTRVAPKMHLLGAGHEYFDLHVEADEHHSVMGLEHIDPVDPDSQRGRQLVAKALEGIALWAEMLHSWIGQETTISFSDDGRLRRLTRTA